MSRIIIPVPPAEPVRVEEIQPGQWISDAHEGPWHNVLDVNLEAGTLTVGDTASEASVVPVSPGQMALRLNPAHAPRTWHDVQTTETETDNKINGPLPGESDETRSPR